MMSFPGCRHGAAHAVHSGSGPTVGGWAPLIAAVHVGVPPDPSVSTRAGDERRTTCARRQGSSSRAPPLRTVVSAAELHKRLAKCMIFSLLAVELLQISRSLRLLRPLKEPDLRYSVLGRILEEAEVRREVKCCEQREREGRARKEGAVIMPGDGGLSRIGLAGLAVMGQNLALNIAEKGFLISVYNRSSSKVDETVERAKVEGNLPLKGFHDPKDFVQSIQKPRAIIILVKAGAPVDQTIATLSEFLEPGDLIIDGGNEWYENTERRMEQVKEKGLLYMGMGVSGGEEGARNGPSMMPGGTKEAYSYIEEVVTKVAAQVDGPCVTYIGPGGAGNFVKMVHNGIEYGDMQLISEAYDVLKSAGGLTNAELHSTFTEWNKGELESFLIEISADIFAVKDDKSQGELLDKILDKTGSKGTGKWTVQQAAELSVAVPTIAASLDSRFLSNLKDERVMAAKLFQEHGVGDILAEKNLDKKQLVDDVRKALYASKITSYTQGMNLIRAKSMEQGWNLNLGDLARIWKGGCIIRAKFLDRIKSAYDRNPNLASLLMDPEFATELVERQAAWRRVVTLAIGVGISTPGMSASLAYFDTYRRSRLPANLLQAQRDYFGAHTYERIDEPSSFHTEWYKISQQNKAASKI